MNTLNRSVKTTALCLLLAGGIALWARAAAPQPVPPAYAPIQWSAGGGAERLAAAARAIQADRDALLALLQARAKADAAKEAGVDVILELSEAFLHYSGFELRPPMAVGLPWRGPLAGAAPRYARTKNEFLPVHEDARLAFQRRGGQWYGPQVGMLSGKFRQQFHLRGCDAGAMKADAAAGVNGEFALTTVRGDLRFDMHMSGEHTDNFISEYNIGDFHIGFGDPFFPDWWAGPRQRMRPWGQRFRLNATDRRGWLLRATLNSPVCLPSIRRGDTDVFLWVDEGRILRGYLGHRDRPFQNVEHVLTLGKWSVDGTKVEVELSVRNGGQVRQFTLHGQLTRADGGRFAGNHQVVKGQERSEGAMAGVLYKAFIGTYTTEGLDGTWSRQVLAGVAPASPEAVPLPAADKPASPEQAFRQILVAYRQAGAIDRALREYPLPLSLALQEAEMGVDNRYDYWPLRCRGKNFPRPACPTAGDHLHEALAAQISPDTAGAAAYAERLAAVIKRAVEDRKAGQQPVLGVATCPDGDFGPYGELVTAERAKAGGNALPPAPAAGTDWRLLGDWTCFGVLPRAYSFDSAPYLPEVVSAEGIQALAKDLPPGQAVRLPHPDEMEHLWCWRAEPSDKDGRVAMSRTLLTPTREKRARWGTNYYNKNALYKKGPGTAHTGVTGDTMDFFYQLMASWYATTVVHAEKAERIWLAAAADWDGRLWINGSLVWRPLRVDTPNRLAVFPLDLAPGANRITVCVSARPIQEGNMGNMGSRIHKYAERTFGSFSVWVGRGGEPRTAAQVAAADEKERADDGKRRAAARVIGRRGDGSACYPDARPPVAWDLDKKINVRWKVALPTGDAEPVIVGPSAGSGQAKHLFITTHEGGLACLDPDTGAELWRKPCVLDGSPFKPADAPTKAIGVTYDRDRLWEPAEPGKPPYDVSAVKSGYAKTCLTPLADDKHVWMQDHRGAVACFTHDGKQVWARAVPAQVVRIAKGQELGARIAPPVPPAIVGSTLIVAAGDGLIAFDALSGEEKWRRTALDYLGRFATMDLGDGPQGRLVLLCSGEVLDAATGKTLRHRCAPEMNDSACQPVVDGRVAYFHAGSSAVRFWLGADGAVRCRVLWDSPADVRKRGSDINSSLQANSFAPTPVLHNGLLITHMAEMMSIMHGPQNSMRVQASDAATGCAVSQRYCVVPNAMHPANSTVVAGDLVLCADRGISSFGSLPAFGDSPKIAVLQATDDLRRLATNPGLKTRSHPVCVGRRIYLAGAEEVVCIERPESLGDKFSEYELAALEKEFFAYEVGPKPAEAVEPIALAPLETLPTGAQTPVTPLLIGDWNIPWDKSKAPTYVGFPWRLCGAWPLPDQPLDDPYAAITGLAGKVVGEKCQVKVGDKTVPFRPLADEMLALGKKVLDRSAMNYFQGVDTFALDPKALFGESAPTRGLFASVLDNRRTYTLLVDAPEGVRVWLAGKEVRNGQYVRMTPGYYPLLMDCRVTAETKAPLAVVLREYPCSDTWAKVQYSPATEPQRRLERIKRNEALLRAIAAGGPKGAYAQDALKTLDAAGK